MTKKKIGNNEKAAELIVVYFRFQLAKGENRFQLWSADALLKNENESELSQKDLKPFLALPCEILKSSSHKKKLQKPKLILPEDK